MNPTVQLNNYSFSVAERFLRYVQLDTQSNPSSSTVPSSQKQKELGKMLVKELLEMGIKDAELDEFGYVYATLPTTSPKKVPIICFCSHQDTSPDCSGTGVKPIIHRNYQGGDIVLPDDASQIIRPSEHTDLKNQIGNDIITASGTTLLGADDKAGIAEIMDAVRFFMMHPEVPHGEIKILFTPDEEIGRGVDHADLKRLNADFAYTMDGETAGSLENETFSADGVIITIEGKGIHPGFAKGRMENAIKIAADIIAALPKTYLSPETTKGQEGFIHPTDLSGSVEKAEIHFIIRDHNTAKLHEYEELLHQITQKIMSNYPNSNYRFEIKEQYRNFKTVLEQFPMTVENALEGIRRSGMEPKLRSIRGGTDGSRLSFMGLPCPNIFTGGHAFHSKHEWVSIQDMQKAVKTIIHTACVWEERAL